MCNLKEISYKDKYFEVIEVGDKKICVAGVGKLFFEGGFPISMSVEEFRKVGVEISFLHLVDELWSNGWSWGTIEKKLVGELSDDINNSLEFDLVELERFYKCLEQPYRSNGGYEKSREMYYNFLFNNESVAIDTLITLCK
jgi:hypothetical protein